MFTIGNVMMKPTQTWPSQMAQNMVPIVSTMPQMMFVPIKNDWAKGPSTNRMNDNKKNDQISPASWDTLTRAVPQMMGKSSSTMFQMPIWSSSSGVNSAQMMASSMPWITQNSAPMMSQNPVPTPKPTASPMSWVSKPTAMTNQMSWDLTSSSTISPIMTSATTSWRAKAQPMTSQIPSTSMKQSTKENMPTYSPSMNNADNHSKAWNMDTANQKNTFQVTKQKQSNSEGSIKSMEKPDSFPGVTLLLKLPTSLGTKGNTKKQNNANGQIKSSVGLHLGVQPPQQLQKNQQESKPWQLNMASNMQQNIGPSEANLWNSDQEQMVQSWISDSGRSGHKKQLGQQSSATSWQQTMAGGDEAVWQQMSKESDLGQSGNNWQPEMTNADPAWQQMSMNAGSGQQSGASWHEDPPSKDSQWQQMPNMWSGSDPQMAWTGDASGSSLMGPEQSWIESNQIENGDNEMRRAMEEELMVSI